MASQSQIPSHFDSTSPFCFLELYWNVKLLLPIRIFFEFLIKLQKSKLNFFCPSFVCFMMVLKLMICNYLILTNHHQRAHTGLFRYVNLLIINFYVYLITRTLDNIYLLDNFQDSNFRFIIKS